MCVHTLVTYGKKIKMLLLFRFFFIHRGVLEINRLDKIARRSKRVGGAIADLWGSHLVGTYLVEKWIGSEFYISRGTYTRLGWRSTAHANGQAAP